MPKMSALSAVNPILAQAATPGASSPLMSLLPMVLIFGAMYFLMIAPQRKKQKALDAMLKALRTGDEIVTTGGIFGTITNVKDDRYVIRISDTTKIEIGKGFVQSVVKKADGEEVTA
jgi:preprotein translocase subunit YajC